MKFKLELRTTISPTPFFFRRVHFLAASLRAMGGPLADHEIVVSVGGGDGAENFYRTQKWSNSYPLIWRTAARDAYARLGYRATNRDRAQHMARADYVMMVDADVIFLRDFSELLASLESAPAICGVMAHVSPFETRPKVTPEYASTIDDNADDGAYWRALGAHYGAGEMALAYEYSGWGLFSEKPARRFAPAYFNGGMVLGPSGLMDEMCALYAEAEDAVDVVMDTYYRPQIARTLAIYKAGLPHRALPFRYNFPNDHAVAAAHPEETANAAILHYLRKDIVDRDANFATRAGVDELVARTDLSGGDEMLRGRVAELRDLVFEEETAS